jgi:acetyl-CoA acyltransferase 1
LAQVISALYRQALPAIQPAMERVSRIVQHVQAVPISRPVPLSAQPTAALSGAGKSDDDVVICCAVRTAVGKAGKGSFKDTPCEDLLAPLYQEMIKRTNIDPKKIGDCHIGNVLQPGAGAGTARMGQFLGGLPIEVPVVSINRQCSSGLQAVASVAASIKAGMIDVGLAGGVESMSMYSMGSGADPSKLSQEILNNDLAKACMIPMGITSENVAEAYNITREKQDQLAVTSHAKALAAQKAGKFDSEIVPVTTKVKDKEGKETQITLAKDEGPREGTTLEGLSKLKPAFKKGGSTTAGNSSQVSDGAALVLLARRSTAQDLGLPILARMRSFAVVGVDPKLMGIGPAFAIPAALEKAQLQVGDVDVFEINEAFASQATMSVEHLKIPLEKVNPNGGALALGHPLGCTGARQIATLIPEMKRSNSTLGVVSMCIGTGMGAASVIENEM